MTSDASSRASCLCGTVQITVTGPLPAPNACHCGQCRKQSGHYWASTDVPRNRITITGSEHVSWYQSSAKVRRGFCGTCGSFLFWDAATLDTLAIAMGAFAEPTRTALTRHIFVADKGDYYRIADGLPQNAQ